MVKLVVAGVGPGGEDYITPAVWKKAREADVLAGGSRALAPFLSLGKKTLPVTADLESLATAIEALPAGCRVVVLVSGDPGFYSLLGFLSRRFGKDKLEVLPGISSLQAAFARIGEPWQGAVLLSAHGRDGESLLPSLLVPGTKAILTDIYWTPDRLAALMLAAGAPDAHVTLCYRLTLPEEKLVAARLSELKPPVEGDCVMVIHGE